MEYSTPMVSGAFSIAECNHSIDQDMLHPHSDLIWFKGCGLLLESLRIKNSEIRPGSFANHPAIRQAKPAGWQRGDSANSLLQGEHFLLPHEVAQEPSCPGISAVEGLAA